MAFLRQPQGLISTTKRKAEVESLPKETMMLVSQPGYLSTSRALLCCLFITLMTGCENVDSEKAPVISGPPSTAFPMPPPSGRSINEMGWELTDGRRQLFSQYHGSVLILDFYATWCLPCRESIPHLVSLQDRYRDKGLTVVGLNVGGPDDWPMVATFAREMKIQYTLAVPDGELGSFLMADRQEIPQTFVFDRQGKLLKRLIGFSDGDADLLEKTIQEAIKKD